jgi:hypothetical protein
MSATTITLLTLALHSLVVLFGHVNFLFKLSSIQPDVWRLYKPIAYSWTHYYSKHRQLQAEVYPLITDGRIIRAMKLEIVLLRIFAALILVGAIVIWRFGPHGIIFNRGPLLIVL